MNRPRRAEAHRDQDEPAHRARDQQARQPELRVDRRQDHDERRGRPGHLRARPAQRGDQHAGDDRRVEPVLGRDADADRQRHRQRQRDDADHQAGEQVGLEVGAV